MTSISIPISSYTSICPIVLSPFDKVERAFEVSTKKRIRHFPVINKGDIVGVISQSDLESVVDEDHSELNVEDLIQLTLRFMWF